MNKDGLIIAAVVAAVVGFLLWHHHKLSAAATAGGSATGSGTPTVPTPQLPPATLPKRTGFGTSPFVAAAGNAYSAKVQIGQP